MGNTRDGNAKTVGVARDRLQEARKHEAGGGGGGGRFYWKDKRRQKKKEKKKRFCVSAHGVDVDSGELVTRKLPVDVQC